MAKTSGGVEASLVSQNGQNVVSPDEFLEMKIGGPDRRGLSHDYPATGKNVFPHLRQLCSNLSQIRLTSLFAPTPHF
jgi:hypothetical protein